MTLGEAIRHEMKQADKNERDVRWMQEQLSKGNRLPLAEKKISRCKSLAEEHRQLGEWLTELQERKEGACKNCKHWYSDADSGMACEFTNLSQPEDGYCNWFSER